VFTTAKQASRWMTRSLMRLPGTALALQVPSPGRLYMRPAGRDPDAQ
jgi:hypothetical protein